MSAGERGFTLIEILVSLAIFAVVVVGALGVLGAAGSGGFFEGFPTGFVATRAARDTTAASVYIQAFQEYAASRLGATLTPGTYCDGLDCSSTSPIVTSPITAANLTGYPTPPAQPFQLDWRRLDITVERWYPCLDTAPVPPVFKRYSIANGADCTINTAQESLTRLRTKITWKFRNVTRTIEVDRFLP